MEFRELVNQIGWDKTSHNPENGTAYPRKIEDLNVDKGISSGKKHEKDHYDPV